MYSFLDMSESLPFGFFLFQVSPLNSTKMTSEALSMCGADAESHEPHALRDLRRLLQMMVAL